MKKVLLLYHHEVLSCNKLITVNMFTNMASVLYVLNCHKMNCSINDGIVKKIIILFKCQKLSWWEEETYIKWRSGFQSLLSLYPGRNKKHSHHISLPFGWLCNLLRAKSTGYILWKTTRKILMYFYYLEDYQNYTNIFLFIEYEVKR